MTEKAKSMSDIFHKILDDPRLYRDQQDYHAARREYELVLTESNLDRSTGASIRLGLLRIDRIRGAAMIGDCSSILTEIRSCSLTDQLVKLRYRLVQTEIVLYLKGDYAFASQELDILLDELKGTNFHYEFGIVANSLAVANMMLGKSLEAEELLQDSLTAFRRIGSRLQYARALHNLGLLLKKTCRYSEAERIYRKALPIFSSLSVIDSLGKIHNNLGVIKLKTGDWKSAQYLLEKSRSLQSGQSSSGRNYPLVNLAHLLLCWRRFDEAGELLNNMLRSKESASRLCVLAREFLGECYLEQGSKQMARRELQQARSSVEQLAPNSDVMTEVTRREAELYVQLNRPVEARSLALSCIRLSVAISDRHELGAALRILGEAYVRLGVEKKAVSAFEASIHTLKSINECYELMRSCIAYAEFLIASGSRDADIYLLEAKQLCRKLEIDFYMCRIMILSSRYERLNGDYMAARRDLKNAEELCEGLQTCDRDRLMPTIRKDYKVLQRAILRASMKSAERLKSLGKLYEDARFPLEELKPEMATDVATIVGAECLFLAQRRNSGFRIPIRYNISINDAKHVLTRQLRRDVAELFRGNDPMLSELSTGKLLVTVPGTLREGYVLNAIVDRERVLKPGEFEYLIASVEAMERVAEEYASVPSSVDLGDFLGDGGENLRHPGGNFSAILTLDPTMIRVIHLAERASATDVPILLEGETGVGKELFAQAIHLQSPRREKPFVVMNAGGVPLNLLESQLFGHVKGSFTDAVIDRVGLIEEADGGTMFLDEIGEMSEELQVKFLRLLENREYRRLGDNALREANVRVVSATNRDLESLLKKGRFREDLYFRLATVRLQIPPLRDRKSDVEFLVRHFLADGLAKIGAATRTVHVDVKAMEAFEFYPWPGNVRELKNEILRNLSLIGNGEVIRFGMLSKRIKDAFRNKDSETVLTRRVERYERRLILKALEENDWNRIKTAERIGIPRTTLLFKMKKLNITA